MVRGRQAAARRAGLRGNAKPSGSKLALCGRLRRARPLLENKHSTAQCSTAQRSAAQRGAAHLQVHRRCGHDAAHRADEGLWRHLLPPARRAAARRVPIQAGVARVAAAPRARGGAGGPAAARHGRGARGGGAGLRGGARVQALRPQQAPRVLHALQSSAGAAARGSGRCGAGPCQTTVTSGTAVPEVEMEMRTVTADTGPCPLTPQ